MSGVREQVATAVVTLIRGAQVGETRHAMIRLDPPELGSLAIEVEWRPEDLKIRIVVERPETLQLLERDASQLARSLEQGGAMSVNVDLRERNPHAESARWIPDSPRRMGSLSIPVAALSGTPVAAHDRLLDIRV
jgi:hypothetical protein